MPSTGYFAELTPDPFLRRCVAWTGVGLILAGIAAIATLPVSYLAQLTIALTWTGVTGWELWRLRAAWSVCHALRIDSVGEIRVRKGDGEWAPARLLPGSILLRHWAWIRIGPTDGTVFAELLRGSCRESHDWRRLRVIARHIGDSR